MATKKIKLKDDNGNILYPRTVMDQIIDLSIPTALDQYIDCGETCVTYDENTTLSKTLSLDVTKPIIFHNLYYRPDWNNETIDYTTTTAQAIIYYSLGHYYEKVRIYNFKNWTITITSVSGFAGNFTGKVGTTVAQNNEDTIWTVDLGTTKPSTTSSASIGISWNSGTQTETVSVTQVGYNATYNIVGNAIKVNSLSSSTEMLCAISGSIDYLKVTYSNGTLTFRLIDQSANDRTRIDMSRFTFEFRTKNSTSKLGMKLATKLYNADKTKIIELYNFRMIRADDNYNNVCILNRNGYDDIYEGYVVKDNQTYTIHIKANPNAAGTTADPYLSYYLYPIDNLYYTDNTISNLYTDLGGYDATVNNTFEYTEDTTELPSGYSNGYIPTTQGKTGVYAYIRMWFYAYEDSSSLTINYYQDGLNHNHYCCFSNLDTLLATGWSDVSTNVKTTTQDVSGAGTISYTGIAKGMHYVTIKFRKNNSAVVSPDMFAIVGFTTTSNTRVLRVNQERDQQTISAVESISPGIIIGAGTPTATPTATPALYVDTTNKLMYFWNSTTSAWVGVGATWE